jgi:hemolysin activation/secretion protein
LRANYALSQTVSDTLSFYGQVQGQVANKNLDSSERFFLGGPLGVRAYPGSEGGGTQGAMVNLEIRQRLPEGFQVIAFYDHGRVQVEKTSTATTSEAPNTYSLRGSGLGVIWNGPQKMVIKALWSRRLGSNPNPASTGMDQDGTRKMDRFWLSASLSF